MDNPERGRMPANMRELTPRAVVVGLGVAVLIGASYPYVVLKFGFGPNISVVSAFFGFLALGLFSKSYNRWENNIVQTAGTTDRKSTRLNSSHIPLSRMPSSA